MCCFNSILLFGLGWRTAEWPVAQQASPATIKMGRLRKPLLRGPVQMYRQKTRETILSLKVSSVFCRQPDIYRPTGGNTGF